MEMYVKKIFQRGRFLYCLGSDSIDIEFRVETLGNENFVNMYVDVLEIISSNWVMNSTRYNSSLSEHKSETGGISSVIIEAQNK